MTYRVNVRPAVERDIADIQRWYDEQRTGLGTEFREALDQLIVRLIEMPAMYPIVHRQVRRAVLRRFPYLVYFTVSEDLVDVRACLHGKRHPRLARRKTR